MHYFFVLDLPSKCSLSGDDMRVLTHILKQTKKSLIFLPACKPLYPILYQNEL